MTARSTASNPSRWTLEPLRLALGFGLWAGWIELVIVLLIRRFDSTIPMSWLRTNRHQVWMIPVSVLILISLLGLVLSVPSPWWRPIRGRVLWKTLTAAACFAFLLNVEGFYPVACLLLAAGVGRKLGGWIERWCRPRARFVTVATVCGFLALAATTVVESLRVTQSEERALASLPAAKPQAKNVLLVVLDNVRASSLSLYGRERPTSPQLERLGKRGVVFAQARSTSSWTLPAHASLMTGRWCHELSFGFDRALDDSEPTLAETFASEGYATAGFVGNTFYANDCYGISRGFARYEDHYENHDVSLFEIVRSTSLGKRALGILGWPIRVDQGASQRKTAEMINRDVLTWLDERPRDRPFFAFLNYFDAHAPFVRPPGDTPRFGFAARSEAEQAETVLREVRLPQTRAGLTPDAVEKIRQEAAQTRLDAYETCIAALDQQIGRLFDELDRRGLTKDTVIVLTSDHGEHFAERGYYGHGLSLYDPEIHVPLLVISPTIDKAGSVVQEPVSLRDVAATVLDLADTGLGGRLPGQSLATYWRSDRLIQPQPVLAELGRRENLVPTPLIPTSVGPLNALILSDQVFIRNGDGREEHYSLGRDPAQRDNLIRHQDHQPTSHTLRSMLEAALSPVQPVDNVASTPNDRPSVTIR